MSLDVSPDGHLIAFDLLGDIYVLPIEGGPATAINSGLAWSIQPDPTYIQICFGAVLGGSVFGDQCSPISDTTILSSMFSGCDLMDHVRTQLPLALAAASLGAVLSTLFALSL